MQSSGATLQCVGDKCCTFPQFPMGAAVSEYAIHMNQTLSAVQQWVYEDVFSCSYFPVLGSHVFSTVSPSLKGYGHCTKSPTKNVFDALERICGRHIRRHFTSLEYVVFDLSFKLKF